MGDVRGHGAHERDAVLGGSDGVGCGHVDNEAAVLDGGGEIDAVDPDAHAADDAEPAAGGLKDIAADLGAGAHDERIAERDLGPELLGGEVVGAVDGELLDQQPRGAQLRLRTHEPAATNEDDAVEETEAQADPEDHAPVHVSDAPTIASAPGTTVSPRKNYKRPAQRGDNPLSPKKKLKGDTLTTGGSVTGSNQLSMSASPKKVAADARCTRSKSRLSSNHACNTRSKRGNLL
ncbi:hypothetical protein ZWY2020_039221 [Hordeum vulgare]|nr:hypothetical protein ZWY2020_039221 [Hordeum vulgare]